MGKYIVYGLIIFIVVFALNFFNVINVPFLDMPDFMTTKEETVTKTDNTIKELD